ncbi:MAG TPA: 3-hydroxyacyl-CoA dehydrogenase family protein [bacterium]|jgi:3-hydroxybutyryl-CoA dehydrogenase
MPDNQLPLDQPELYALGRILIAGPVADARPFADKVAAAGHSVTLLVPEEDIEFAGKAHKVLAPEEAIDPAEYSMAIELHCASLEAKADVLFYLDDSLNEDTLILTYTLAISTGELAREMMMPERVVGISILPPISETKFVELMVTPHTSAEALSRAGEFFKGMGLGSAQVTDSPGGVLGRTVCCLVNEAAMALQERIASAEEIDQAMKLGVNYPFGPLAWGDRIGLDRVLAVMDGLYAEFKEERYRPAPLLKRLVRAGHIGVRAGTGFFTHRHA